jgi:hypothetical protein
MFSTIKFELENGKVEDWYFLDEQTEKPCYVIQNNDTEEVSELIEITTFVNKLQPDAKDEADEGTYLYYWLIMKNGSISSVKLETGWSIEDEIDVDVTEQ